MEKCSVLSKRRWNRAGLRSKQRLSRERDRVGGQRLGLSWECKECSVGFQGTDPDVGQKMEGRCSQDILCTHPTSLTLFPHTGTRQPRKSAQASARSLQCVGRAGQAPSCLWEPLPEPGPPATWLLAPSSPKHPKALTVLSYEQLVGREALFKICFLDQVILDINFHVSEPQFSHL